MQVGRDNFLFISKTGILAGEENWWEQLIRLEEAGKPCHRLVPARWDTVLGTASGKLWNISNGASV
jgi:hypothetical protein